MTTDTFVHGNPQILVVDDEETTRENLQGLLESSGFAPTVAADGQEALERAAEQDFAVVLMDIKMPRMSGIEALPKLHKQRPDAIIIMTTGVGDAEMAMEAVRLGAHDYLVKPLDFDAVITKIRDALTERLQRLRDQESQENIKRKVKDLVETSEANFAELVRVLGREHALLFATDQVTKVGRERILTDLSPELQRPRSPASRFKKTFALRIAYLFMLGCAAYAPIELARLIVWHHDTYGQLTLVPVFGLELAVLAWGTLGVVLAVAHAWFWVFGLTGRRLPSSLVELPLRS